MAYKREIAIVLLMIVLLGGVWMLVNRVGSSSGAAQTEFVTKAVHNAALTCYAVEGDYPDSLDYLKDNYRLSFDEERIANAQILRGNVIFRHEEA